jgi:hypothetical protein
MQEQEHANLISISESKAVVISEGIVIRLNFAENPHNEALQNIERTLLQAVSKRSLIADTR